MSTPRPCRLSTALAPLALAALAAACSSSSSEPSDAGPSGADAGTTDATAGDPNVLAGSFQVKLVAPTSTASDGYTSVVGKIYDGATPQAIVWEESSKSGACALLKPRVPSCATPCGGSAVCVEDDTCKPYPSAKSVGTVTVTGVHTATGETQFSMTPVANNYQPTGTLPYPAFAEGDDIRFAAEGGAYAAFAVQAKGIAPLALTTGDLALEAGQALTLAWTPAGVSDLSTIHVKLDVSHHGGSKGKIECDTADTGSLQIDASLMTELLGLGVAGFPSIIVTRKAVGSTTIEPGRVELVVSSEVEEPVTVPGLQSCTSNDECSGGQTCQADLTCR